MFLSIFQGEIDVDGEQSTSALGHCKSDNSFPNIGVDKMKEILQNRRL